MLCPAVILIGAIEGQGLQAVFKLNLQMLSPRAGTLGYGAAEPCAAVRLLKIINAAGWLEF